MPPPALRVSSATGDKRPLSLAEATGIAERKKFRTQDSAFGKKRSDCRPKFQVKKDKHATRHPGLWITPYSEEIGSLH
jgi:hypothetical protein